MKVVNIASTEMMKELLLAATETAVALSNVASTHALNPPRHCERKRSNPSHGITDGWIASSLALLAMTASIIMAGLEPAIHVFLSVDTKRGCPGQARA